MRAESGLVGVHLEDAKRRRFLRTLIHLVVQVAGLLAGCFGQPLECGEDGCSLAGFRDPRCTADECHAVSFDLVASVASGSSCYGCMVPPVAAFRPRPLFRRYLLLCSYSNIEC